MSKAGLFETIVGAIVLAVAAVFLVYAYGASGKSISQGAYRLEAVFGQVAGITVGSDVTIAGVKIGTVATDALDPKTYEARLGLSIARDVAVPEDSIAKIVSDGLLGTAHVSIEPGASDDMLADGGVITQTQGSVDLLALAVKAFTSPDNSKGGADKSDKNPASGESE
ncbi:MAG TPA: outer membrane lipid asymmetry maintenance protein MlaD [Parvularculaceae bacterium]|nr:outer membrane lipid asymmetry maintenance protein MlaD [Parvularculaceae bacterium]